MNDISTHTKAPNSNLLPFKSVSPAAPSSAEVHVEAFTPVGMPERYTADEFGIYELRENEEGDELSTLICSPLVVKGRCRDSVGHGWGLVLAVRDPDGTWHELVLNGQQLNKSPNVALAPLFGLGFELQHVEKAANSVMKLLQTWRPKNTYCRIDRIGWTSKQHDAFVLGSGRVIGHSLVTTDSVSEELMRAMHTRGTFEAWKKDVAARCVGNPLMMLAVSHAFTGPLLSILGLSGGGFHLCGRSSRGKSTIQYVATSVWGERSLLHSWNGTVHGFEAIAAACNDTLLNVEELHNADPRTVGDIIYMLANGVGKIRAKSNGKSQTSQQWRVPILSSGEVSLADHMASAARKIFAGQEVRMINLEADGRAHGAFDALHDKTSAKLFAEGVDHACFETYGHAGPRFVEALMRNAGREQMYRNVLDKLCAEISEEADIPPGGEVQRVLKRFAIAALAGEMATKFGLTGWPKGGAFLASKELFLTWFDDKERATNEEIATAVQRTKDYVSKHLDRFQTIDSKDHDPVDGWRDETWFYIRPDLWRAIHAGHDPAEMARLHADAGILQTQKGGYQVRMPRAIEGRPRAYAVNASKLLGAPLA